VAEEADDGDAGEPGTDPLGEDLPADYGVKREAKRLAETLCERRAETIEKKDRTKNERSADEER
jgi:hypothetical protein